MCIDKWGRLLGLSLPLCWAQRLRVTESTFPSRPLSLQVYVCPKVKGPLAHLEFQLRKVMDAIFKEKFQLLNGDHEGLQGSGMQGPGVGLPTVPVWGQSSSASAASCDMLQSLEQPLVGSLGEDGWGPGQAEL